MNKSIQKFFMQTYGISEKIALKMCFSIGVAPHKLARAVSEFKKEQAFVYLKLNLNYDTGLSLKNKELNTFIYYNQINNIKSFKFKCFLPINGQRNKTNGKTARKQAKIINRLIFISKKVKK